ncbi:MAG: fumarylacetoacetate hydrolase family protein [Actinomycetota bacterium]
MPTDADPSLPDQLDQRIDAAASALIEARRTRVPLVGLSATVVPPDVVTGERIDDRVAARIGWDVSGWKIGCTSEHAQRVLNSPGPMAGRVYTVLESTAEAAPVLSEDELMVEPLLEGEFAFTIGQDLTPDGGPYDRAAVKGAVADVRPAIEIVGGRFSGFTSHPIASIVADAGSNTALVLGPAVGDIDLDRLVDVAGAMVVDGEVVGSGTGADVLGDPIEALRWLVDNLVGRGITLAAGQVVTTGTLTQLAPFPPGATAVARFDGLGEASVRRPA